MIDIVEGLRFSDSLLSVIHYPADYVLTLMKGEVSLASAESDNGSCSTVI